MWYHEYAKIRMNFYWSEELTTMSKQRTSHTPQLSCIAYCITFEYPASSGKMQDAQNR